MADDGFQRARSPERKAERREAILQAARDLLDEGGADAATLSAIAARAGVVKSGLYRYFESREEILIQLLISSGERMVDDLERRCAGLAASGEPREMRVKALAGGVAAAFAAEPRICQLVAIMSGTLENNLSSPKIMELKTRMYALHQRAARAACEGHGALSLDGGDVAMRSIWAMVAGFWPMCNPGPAVAAAIENLDLPAFSRGFEATLRSGVHAALLGAEEAAQAERDGSAEALRAPGACICGTCGPIEDGPIQSGPIQSGSAEDAAE